MNTKKLKQLVLDLAIHGKLVPQDPNDEPASELLKRIQADVETHGRASNKSKGKKSAITSVDLDEVPFEVPEGWCWCRLSDIAKIGTGSTPATTNKSYYDGSIAWISSGSTKEDYIEHATAYITDLAIKETNCQVYPVGTLIMAMYGEGKTRGQISELKIEAATNQACAAIQLEEETLKDYIKVYLMGNYWSLREMAEGGLQPNLNLKKISSYLIPLPPLSEQHRIVAAIEKWFAVIDQLEKNEADLKKSIEQTKKKVLDLAIRGKLVESEGEWEEKRLGDVAEYINGRAFKPEEWEISGMPIIRIQNLNDESAKYNYTSQRFEDKYIVNRGDLLFAWAASLGTYIWKGEDAWLNQHIFKVVPRDFISKRFLHIVLDALISDFYTQSHGSGMVHITRKSFENIKIPVPSLAEQKRIVEKVEEVMGELDKMVEMM